MCASGQPVAMVTLPPLAWWFAHTWLVSMHSQLLGESRKCYYIHVSSSGVAHSCVISADFDHSVQHMSRSAEKGFRLWQQLGLHYTKSRGECPWCCALIWSVFFCSYRSLWFFNPHCVECFYRKLSSYYFGEFCNLIIIAVVITV